MATDEAIFRGSPAAFESAVRAYDRRLGEQYGTPLGAMLIYKTALIPGVPTKQDVAEVTVAISDLRLAEAASRGGSWDSPGLVLYWNWRATITAHSMPDNRSRLFLRCEDAIWPVVREHWRALLAELSRLGMIERGEPPPVAEQEPEPARKKPKRGGGNRSRYTDKERREACEQYRQLGGGMTQDEFMKERYGGMSGRALRDWLKEFGL